MIHCDRNVYQALNSLVRNQSVGITCNKCQSNLSYSPGGSTRREVAHAHCTLATPNLWERGGLRGQR